MKFPYFLALDVDEKDKALAMAQDLSDCVGGFKVGPRLSFKYGASFISELAAYGPVFVDNKYYDIPSTMKASVRASFLAGASFCTVHAGSGSVALREMAELEEELSKIRFFKILAVTVLTSFDESNQPAHWKEIGISEQVKALALDVKKSGLRGIVCSPHEVAALKALCPEFFLVTPGIRDDFQDNKDDQKRTMSVEAALSAGSNALVIGRPIVRADSPRDAALKINCRIKQAAVAQS